MPNMFGGDQFHPAYDPRTELTADQVMVGNRVYTRHSDGRITWEDVDGSTGPSQYTWKELKKLVK